MLNTATSKKLPAIVLAALVINALMFIAIEYMVGNRRIRLTETTDFDISNFIRVAEDSREVRSRRDPQAPEKPQNEMQQDMQTLTDLSRGGSVSGLQVSFPDIDLSIDVGGGISVARELTPLVRIPPEYPASALMRGIQGQVVLRFTVTETGAVADPEVLRSDPPGIFDRAAIRAVLRWKYQPQFVDGKPASVVSYTRINFEIQGKE